jgi:hypothetical protein
MVTVGLLVRLVAKPGKEAEVTSFLEGGLALVEEEPATTSRATSAWERPWANSSAACSRRA